MEPHMIENELFSYLFVFEINHVGFTIIIRLTLLILHVIHFQTH